MHNKLSYEEWFQDLKYTIDIHNSIKSQQQYNHLDNTKLQLVNTICEKINTYIYDRFLPFTARIDSHLHIHIATITPEEIHTMQEKIEKQWQEQGIKQQFESMLWKQEAVASVASYNQQHSTELQQLENATTQLNNILNKELSEGNKNTVDVIYSALYHTMNKVFTALIEYASQSIIAAIKHNNATTTLDTESNVQNTTMPPILQDDLRDLRDALAKQQHNR